MAEGRLTLDPCAVCDGSLSVAGGLVDTWHMASHMLLNLRCFFFSFFPVGCEIGRVETRVWGSVRSEKR